jgi:hypothetical protein
MQKDFLATFKVIYQLFKPQVDSIDLKLRLLLGLTGVTDDELKESVGLEPVPRETEYSIAELRKEAESLRESIQTQIKTSEPERLKVCEICARTAEEVGKEKLHICGKCRNVRYCSVECQRAHWPIHKPVCK